MHTKISKEQFVQEATDAEVPRPIIDRVIDIDSHYIQLDICRLLSEPGFILEGYGGQWQVRRNLQTKEWEFVETRPYSTSPN